MKKPNTFIVGAPKCGTTAMAYYLSQHPDVFVPTIKEPHYFIKEDMPLKTNLTYDAYLNLFSDVKEEKVIIDASVWYLYSKKAIEQIKKFSPNAKIIIMLRRPDEMVYSMHQQAYITRNEDVREFKKAWNLIQERKKNKSVPKHCKDVSMLYYDEIAKYADQIKRVFKRFNRNQNVKIVLYEDFKKNPKSVHLSVLKFLGIEPLALSKYEVINKNKTIRSAFLANITRRPSRCISKITCIMKSLLGIKKIGFLDSLRNLNEKEKERLPLDEALRLEIVERYKKNISELSVIIDKDLTEWQK